MRFIASALTVLLALVPLLYLEVLVAELVLAVVVLAALLLPVTFLSTVLVLLATVFAELLPLPEVRLDRPLKAFELRALL